MVERFLGRSFVMLSREQAVQHILVGNPDNYVRPHAAARILSPPIGGGLFLAAGAEWRRQRRLLAPSFSPRAATEFARHAADLGGRMVAGLHAEAPGPVPLYARLQSLTLAVAARSLFAVDMAPYDGAVTRIAREYDERMAQPGVLDLLLPPAIPSLRDLRRRRFRRRWMALIAGIVADRRRQAPPAPGLFETLAASETAPGLFEAQVATLLVTGSETTTAALFWAVHLVSDRPDLQAAVAEEAQELDLGPDGAHAALPQLVTARAVVQEAMRLYPPAFSIVRQAVRADVAGGTPVPAGAIVQAAPWVIHRHRRLWDRPDTFDPARFMPGAPPPPRYSYLPFGYGPRACIGAQVAAVEAVLVLALLLRAFHVSPARAGPVAPVARITLQPYDPPPFHLQPRVPARSARATPAQAAHPSP